MNISDFCIYRYSLPFVRPILMMNHSLETREGLLVRLKTANGLEAFGDIPPFPGLSDESIELAFIQLDEICRSLNGKENPVRAWSPERIPLLFPELYPSVAFGIESALLDLAAQQAGKSLSDFLSIKTHKIKSNGLVTSTLEDVLQRAKQLVDAGFTCLKIKVGRDTVENEIDILHRIANLIDKNVKLRLDANKAWNFDQAIQFCRGIDGLTIDYIEEPLADTSKLDEFYQKTHMPIALDESLTPEWIESPPKGVTAFIIKPGIHGGVFDIITLIKKSRMHKIKPIISSAFLGAVGLKMAVTLSAAFANQEDVMGLDTTSWLTEDFLMSPLSLQNGFIDLLEIEKKLTIRPELLKRII